MHQTLKLTITAVGEPGSIFMRPCDPITLHESEIDLKNENEDSNAGFEFGDASEDSVVSAADALMHMDTSELLVLAEDESADHRRAS